MGKFVSEQEYMDYEFLNREEAAYQGYDTEDDLDASDEFSVMESDRDDDVDFSDDDSEDGDITDDDSGERGHEHYESSDDIDDWFDTDDSSDADSARKRHFSSESYTLNGREYKDPRKYIQAIYQLDVSENPQLDADEQIRLAQVVRRGMLCDCSIMPENPDVPKEYPYRLVDKTSKVLRRLHQTEEEKTWVESLSEVEKRQYIEDGRAAQEKLISHSLPLVMDIAGTEHNRMEYLDRVQAGNVGLLKAVQYFNPYKGVRFVTFATYLIRNEIRDAAKEWNMQSSGLKTWENLVPTEQIIDALCDRMGGKYWMQEITVDTDQTEEQVKKQVGILLEQKVLAESIVNDIILGRPQRYDDVLISAEESDEDYYATMRAEWNTAADDGEDNDSDYTGRRPCFDIIKGDGKPPRDGEMSIEDYVRLFFAAVIEAKTVTHVKLAGFVLKDMKLIQQKADSLKAFLDQDWKYTENAAISDLRQLIKAGDIWPERHMIEQAKTWGWAGLSADTKDERRNDFSDFVDQEHITESTALILQEGYVALRQSDILEATRITLEYYEWLDEIIRLTITDRLDDQHKLILAGLADRVKYKELQEKHHISPNTITRRKEEICRCIYDQIVESTNRENGDVLMKCLTYRYQVYVIGSWKKYVIDRMKRDHFVEKERFALRSRLTDSQRPPMERFSLMMTSVMDSVSTAAEMIRQSFNSDAIRSVRVLANVFASDAFRDMMEEWERNSEEDWLEEDADGDSSENGGIADIDASDTHSIFRVSAAENINEMTAAEAV